MDDLTRKNLQDYFPGAENVDPQIIGDLFDIASVVEDIQHHIRELAQETGMPSVHFFLLEHLALNGGAASLGDLLRVLNLPKQSATYIVDRLEKDMLVKRRPDPNDRRRYEVALTTKGKKLAKNKMSPFYETLLNALQVISKKDRESTAKTLEKFRDGLRDREE